MSRVRIPKARGLWVGILAGVFAGQAVAGEPFVAEDAHPPIGVFGEAVHHSGEVKLSYRLQIGNQQGLQDGRTEIQPSQIEDSYPGGSIPLSLRSYAHVIELTWKPVESVTLFVTLPFYERTLDQFVESTGQRYSVSVRGFGDVILNGLYRVFSDEVHRVHLNLGLSLPSGSTNETAEAPAGLGGVGGVEVVEAGTLQRLPYPMQLGSGTLALRPGFTYNGLYKKTFWGGQILGVLQAGTNSEGYKPGNEYSLTGWVGRRWKPWLRTSFRMKWQQWFNPTGVDDQMNPALSPLANPGFQAGQRVDALFGVDFYVQEGRLRGSRISIEAGLPAFQDLEGPQLRTDWLLTAGLQYAF
ncbi:MAG TPA: transporter [Myxococcales bacterium]|nr:transporter [Myxococcales bacterium]